MNVPPRPAWLISGALVFDSATGRTGRVLAVERPFDYTGAGSQTAFCVPVGGGIGWEAEYTALRPATEQGGLR